MKSGELFRCNPVGESICGADLIDDAPEVCETATSPAGIKDLTWYSPPLEGMTLEEASNIVDALDPDCSRREWIATGMALKHQFEYKGFEIWDHWSASGEKYPGEDELRREWKSFKAQPSNRAPITMRTIKQRAKHRHGDKPPIVLPGGDVSITAAAEQIFGLIGAARMLFFRGGRAHAIAANPDGTRRLDPITPAQFRSRLEDFGKVCVRRTGANNEQVFKPTLCPEATARALLESRPAGELLPNVATLSACPVLARLDGKVEVLGPGWHPLGGGLFVTGGEMPPRVPLAEAVESLTGILDDFDFASPGDRSRALASLIGPGLRFGGWLSNPLPVDIGEADASQSGKTYRQKVVAAIYREACNVVVQRARGVGGLDESISQKLIDGRPFVLLDNLRGKLDSPFLEAILTAPGTMGARVPHRGEVQVDPRGFVFQMTSNGVETTRDLANRASLVRIRKRPAGFAFRSFPEGDLFGHVVANQPRFLGCVFAVIREWAAKGQPRTKETRHDFREWAQILDWIARHVFDAAPLLDGYEAARQRVSDPKRNWLRALCIALRDAGRKGEHFASTLAEFAVEADLMPPNVRGDADEEATARAIGKVMASVFGADDEIEVDGFRLRRAKRYSSTAEKDILVYVFSEPPPA